MKFLRFLAAFVLGFMLVSPASAMTGNSGQAAHYLALGDSLAAGMIQDGSIGKGYSDFLAEMLEGDELLASYNKGFAVPGAKTTDVMTAIENNIAMLSSATKEEVKILAEIKKADVITLSLGANDVLSTVKFNADGTITYDLPTVTKTIQQTAENMNTILEQISAINPSADVFVMGLYNPTPHLTNYSFVLNLLVSQIDTAIQKVVVANRMYFVPIKDTMAANAAEYLPNPKNIHPSEIGYKGIAERFYTPVKEYIGLIPMPEVVDYPTFKDVKDSSGAKEYIGKAAYYGLVKGYPDGTFKPNKKLTRVQVTSILARSLKLTEYSTVPYTDISKLAEGTQREVTAAYHAGLLKTSDKFNPNTPITRLEVAQMIDKAYTYVKGEVYKPVNIAPFTDISKLTKEQKRVVTLLYDLGIATGSNGKYMPNSTLTRAQAAKMMVELYEKLEL